MGAANHDWRQGELCQLCGLERSWSYSSETWWYRVAGGAMSLYLPLCIERIEGPIPPGLMSSLEARERLGMTAAAFNARRYRRRVFPAAVTQANAYLWRLDQVEALGRGEETPGPRSTAEVG